jgi:hypothetical protein
VLWCQSLSSVHLPCSHIQAKESAHLTQVPPLKLLQFSVAEYALAVSLPGRITYRNLLSLVNILCKQAERHQIKEALTGFNLQVEKTLSNTVCILRCAHIFLPSLKKLVRSSDLRSSDLICARLQHIHIEDRKLRATLAQHARAFVLPVSASFAPPPRHTRTACSKGARHHLSTYHPPQPAQRLLSYPLLPPRTYNQDPNIAPAPAHPHTNCILPRAHMQKRRRERELKT